MQSQPTGDVPHLRRGVPMPPTPLDGKPLPLDDPRDRRAVFADWLTSPDNPYFAKALVNRVWRNFLGRGLVEAEDDLRQTNPPTNPELLDALAKDFVAHGYDVKHLIRPIMNSATYQRSSEPAAGTEADDRFYSHYLVRRLPAEVILDAYSQVTGVPTPFDQLRTGSGRGGDGADGPVPAGHAGPATAGRASGVATSSTPSAGRSGRRPAPANGPQDASVSQALHLNNGQTLNDKLRAQGARWCRSGWTQKASDEEIDRRPVPASAVTAADDGEERMRLPAVLTESAKAGTDRREALEDLAWGVLTGREFLFNR